MESFPLKVRFDYFGSMVNFGYCCINMTLKERGITTNRGMVRRTFDEKGLGYVGELAIKNIADLYQILKWNASKEIRVFRISSDLFPWMSEYEFQDLPNFSAIQNALRACGQYAIDNGIRLSFHPGQFVVLSSPHPSVVQNAILDLLRHAQILDLMGLDRSYYYPINIHIGGAYGDKESALQRWHDVWSTLPPEVKSRLVVENDDKLNMFSVSDLVILGIPVTFDYHHHEIHSGGLTESEAFHLAYSTWQGIRPLFHVSNSKKLWEDNSTKGLPAHADYIYKPIETYGKEVDIDIEAKAKELATLQYLQEFVQ